MSPLIALENLIETLTQALDVAKRTHESAVVSDDVFTAKAMLESKLETARFWLKKIK